MKTSVLFGCLALPTLLVLGCQNNPAPSDSQALTPVDSIAKPIEKPVVYQMMTRLFGNTNTTNKPYGTLAENGVGKFSQITDAALVGLKELGVTHVWYTGVLEHATMTAFPDANISADDADVVKGRAGSPYAIKDYYDVTPLLADNPKERMAEFKALLARTHAQDLKVLIDFVPNHVARSYRSDVRPTQVADLGETDDPSQAYAVNNNFYYLPGTSFVVPKENNPLLKEVAPGEDQQYNESPARVTGNNVFSASPSINDWFETIKLNYGIEYKDGQEIKHFDPQPDTWAKMRDILLHWAGIGVDGFRCDVAEMVPVEFWAWVIPAVKAKYPEVIFIAEIYNPNAYVAYVEQGKFDYLYDKVGTYDAVRELMSGKGTVARIDSARLQSKGIERNMLRFLENHDEQRIASKDFAGDPWTAVPGMTVSATLSDGPVMLYFAQEVGEPGSGAEGFGGEDGRTTIFDFWGVPQHQRWVNNGKYDGGLLSSDQQALRKFYGKLMRLVRENEALRLGSYIALPPTHEKVYAFLRHHGKTTVLVIANFDRAAPQTVSLLLPAAACQEAGLPGSGSLVLSDLLRTDRTQEVDMSLIGTKGIELALPANDAFIFALKAK
jgi:glycosidase